MLCFQRHELLDNFDIFNNEIFFQGFNEKSTYADSADFISSFARLTDYKKFLYLHDFDLLLGLHVSGQLHFWHTVTQLLYDVISGNFVDIYLYSFESDSNSYFLATLSDNHDLEIRKYPEWNVFYRSVLSNKATFVLNKDCEGLCVREEISCNQFRLVCFKETDPFQRYKKFLQDNQFDEALKTAAEHKLDLQSFYNHKCVWYVKNNTYCVETEDMLSLLQKIENLMKHDTLLSLCLDLTFNTYDEQFRFLQILISHLLRIDVDGFCTNDEDKENRRRDVLVKLFRQMKRLETFDLLNGSKRYSAQMFRDFCEADFFTQFLLLLSNEHHHEHALLLWSRHKNEMESHFESDTCGTLHDTMSILTNIEPLSDLMHAFIRDELLPLIIPCRLPLLKQFCEWYESRLVNLPQLRALDLVQQFLNQFTTDKEHNQGGFFYLGMHPSESLLCVPNCLDKLNALRKDLLALQQLSKLYQLHLDLVTYRSCENRPEALAYYMLEEVSDAEELERALEKRIRAYLRAEKISEQNFFETAIYQLLNEMRVVDPGQNFESTCSSSRCAALDTSWLERRATILISRLTDSHRAIAACVELVRRAASPWQPVVLGIVKSLLHSHPEDRSALVLRWFMQEARAQEIFRKCGVLHNLSELSYVNSCRLLLRLMSLRHPACGPLSIDLVDDLRFLADHFKLKVGDLGNLLTDALLQSCDLMGLAALLDDAKNFIKLDAADVLRRCVRFSSVALSQPISATSKKHFDFQLELAFWSSQRLLQLLSVDSQTLLERSYLKDFRKALDALRAMYMRFGVMLGIDRLECSEVDRTVAIITAVNQLDNPVDRLCEVLNMIHVLHVPGELLRAACIDKIMDSSDSNRIESALRLTSEWVSENGKNACESWCLLLLCEVFRQMNSYIENIFEKPLPDNLMADLTMIVQSLVQHCPSNWLAAVLALSNSMRRTFILLRALDTEADSDVDVQSHSSSSDCFVTWEFTVHYQEAEDAESVNSKTVRAALHQVMNRSRELLGVSGTQRCKALLRTDESFNWRVEMTLGSQADLVKPLSTQKRHLLALGACVELQQTLEDKIPISEAISIALRSLESSSIALQIAALNGVLLRRNMDALLAYALAKQLVNKAAPTLANVVQCTPGSFRRHQLIANIAYQHGFLTKQANIIARAERLAKHAHFGKILAEYGVLLRAGANDLMHDKMQLVIDSLQSNTHVPPSLIYEFCSAFQHPWKPCLTASLFAALESKNNSCNTELWSNEARAEAILQLLLLHSESSSEIQKQLVGHFRKKLDDICPYDYERLEFLLRHLCCFDSDDEELHRGLKLLRFLMETPRRGPVSIEERETMTNQISSMSTVRLPWHSMLRRASGHLVAPELTEPSQVDHWIRASVVLRLQPDELFLMAVNRLIPELRVSSSSSLLGLADWSSPQPIDDSSCQVAQLPDYLIQAWHLIQSMRDPVLAFNAAHLLLTRIKNGHERLLAIELCRSLCTKNADVLAQQAFDVNAMALQLQLERALVTLLPHDYDKDIKTLRQLSPTELICIMLEDGHALIVLEVVKIAKLSLKDVLASEVWKWLGARNFTSDLDADDDADDDATVSLRPINSFLPLSNNEESVAAPLSSCHWISQSESVIARIVRLAQNDSFAQLLLPWLRQLAGLHDPQKQEPPQSLMVRLRAGAVLLRIEVSSNGEDGRQYTELLQYCRALWSAQRLEELRVPGAANGAALRLLLEAAKSANVVIEWLRRLLNSRRSAPASASSEMHLARLQLAVRLMEDWPTQFCVDEQQNQNSCSSSSEVTIWCSLLNQVAERSPLDLLPRLLPLVYRRTALWTAPELRNALNLLRTAAKDAPVELQNLAAQMENRAPLPSMVFKL